MESALIWLCVGGVAAVVMWNWSRVKGWLGYGKTPETKTDYMGRGDPHDDGAA